IPVYSELLGRGRYDEAGRVAGAVFALLVAIAGLVSLLGIAFAPLLVTIFTPGFEGERRELMIAVTRILFPMTGVLVLSAWALGVLNSHRRFFVPYFAPVLWNAAIIGSFVLFGSRLNLDGLLIAVACGALLGGLLQLGVQLPWVLRLERRLRFAQTLYLLPISLFGMSVAAAALPDLARQREAHADAMRANVSAAARRVAFYVVPSFTAFVLLGDTFVAGLFETGEFGEADVAIVWMTLAAYSIGLLASTTSRVYQSAFFALRDTRTPARIAGVRVAVSVLAGLLAMLQLERIS